VDQWWRNKEGNKSEGEKVRRRMVSEIGIRESGGGRREKEELADGVV
jgi:hypothetical protein